MPKYCSKCDKMYFEDYNYCPMCSSELESVNRYYREINSIISYVNSRDSNLYKIDEENMVVKFKWNNEWISTPILEIIIDAETMYTPPQPSFFELVGDIKNKWDNLLEKDCPDFNNKLTFNQVKYCEGMMRLALHMDGGMEPRFVKIPKIADFSNKDVICCLKDKLIYDFYEINENGLYLILIPKKGYTNWY